MAEKLFMIALSPTMTEGTIATWKIEEGAAFKAGSILCEVETDKASMDYEAPKEGVLLKITLPAGGVAAVGDTIAIIGKAGEDPGPLLAELSSSASTPRLPPSTSPKSPAPPTSPQAGEPHPSLPARESSRPTVPAVDVGRNGPSAPASYPPSSPLARKLARERGIDLRLVAGTGPGGRVVSRDLETAPAAPLGSASIPAASAIGDRRLPVGAKRGVIARRLSESFFTAPHYYLKKKVHADRLLEARAAINKGRESPISLNAFFIKLAAVTLARHPEINVSWEGESILQRASIDIGLAVALPDGLITPVVRDCGHKGIEAIESEFAALIEKAKSRGLSPAEFEGAGFTITNLGSFGIDEFTAIINPPASAILALGALRREAEVLEDGSIEPRRFLRLSLGCDHRAIDGAVGAAFLRDLAASIEEPFWALL